MSKVVLPLCVLFMNMVTVSVSLRMDVTTAHKNQNSSLNLLSRRLALVTCKEVRELSLLHYI
jgi:hypothetical protein